MLQWPIFVNYGNPNFSSFARSDDTHLSPVTLPEWTSPAPLTLQTGDENNNFGRGQLDNLAVNKRIESAQRITIENMNLYLNNTR